MRTWMFLIVPLALTACHDTEAWLGLFQTLEGEDVLGEAPLRQGVTLDFIAPDANADRLYGYVLESSDPSVVRAATLDEAADDWDAEDLDAFPTDQAVWFGDPAKEDEAGSVAVRLVTDTPGTATLTWRDPVDGHEVDAVEVEVLPATQASLVPRGAARWAATRDLPPISVAGSAVVYQVAFHDAWGQPLVGPVEQIPVVGGSVCPLPDGCDDALFPVGVHTVEVAGVPVHFEVVDPADIVALELREAADDELGHALVVGTDADGRAIRGLPAAWSGVADQGDLYVYEPGAQPVDVTVAYGDLDAHTTVFQSSEGATVRRSDDTSGCSTAPGAGWLGLFVLSGLGLVRRRR